MVYGDDFTTLGAARDLDWFEKEIAGRKEVKLRGRRGNSKGDHQEVKLLNRAMRITQEGVEVEADPRHAELIIKELGLAGGRSASTPAVRRTKTQEEEEDVELDAQRSKIFKSAAARANYLRRAGQT